MIDGFVLSLWERSGGQVHTVTQSSWMSLMKPVLRSKTDCACVHVCVCVWVCVHSENILTTANELLLLCFFGDVCLFPSSTRVAGLLLKLQLCAQYDIVYCLLAWRRVNGLTSLTLTVDLIVDPAVWLSHKGRERFFVFLNPSFH